MTTTPLDCTMSDATTKQRTDSEIWKAKIAALGEDVDDDDDDDDIVVVANNGQDGQQQQSPSPRHHHAAAGGRSRPLSFMKTIIGECLCASTEPFQTSTMNTTTMTTQTNNKDSSPRSLSSKLVGGVCGGLLGVM